MPRLERPCHEKYLFPLVRDRVAPCMVCPDLLRVDFVVPIRGSRLGLGCLEASLEGISMKEVMPRKVKPKILEFLPGSAPAVVYGMRKLAIDLMLRDMWCAAARELAERSER
jgi:hypothetical protein